MGRVKEWISNHNKIAEELYLLLVTIIACLSWYFNYQVGYVIFGIIIFLVLVLFKNTAYSIPLILFALFLPRGQLNKSTSLFPYVFAVILLASGIIVHLIRFRKKYYFRRFTIGFVFLGFSSIISIFLSPYFGKSPLVFLGLAWVLYGFTYFFFSNTIEGNKINYFCNISLYLGILMSSELFFSLNIFRGWQECLGSISSYYVGWGISNDAGIIILCVLPFGIYKLIKSKGVIELLITFIKIAILVLGITITTSRGCYLFGGLLLFSLLIFAFIETIRTRNKKAIIALSSAVAIVLIFVIVYMKIDNNNFVLQIFNKLKNEGLGDNGRFDLWKRAINVFKESPIFGRSFVTEFDNNNRIIVYHSTFFEALGKYGIIGVIGILIFIFQKYFFMVKNNCILTRLLIIGAIIIDIYGLVDNTYGMIGYTLYLITGLSILDAGINEEKNMSNKANDLQIKTNNI